MIDDVAETPSNVYTRLPVTDSPPRLVTVTPQVTFSPACTTEEDGKAMESTRTSGASRMINDVLILSLSVFSWVKPPSENGSITAVI